MELPDWLRGIVLIGKYGAEYRVVGVDEDGYLGVILKAAAEMTVDGDVNVTQEDSIREMQGADGATLRTVVVDANGQIIMVPRGSTGNYMLVDASGFLTAMMKGRIEGAGTKTVSVDADGQIIMVPRGNTGNYMAVDASGYLGAILMADAAVTIAANVTVDQENAERAIQGLEGATLRTVAVDANGQIIMVPRGSTGNYMKVDASGFLTAVMRGNEAGVGGHTVAVDADGQIIMVPRGSTGNYLGVDANGFMTTVMKGTYGAVLKTLAADDEGYLVAILKDNTDQWGKKISVGLAELAARLGSPISWDRRGQVAQIVTFAHGFGHMAKTASAGGGVCALYPGLFQTGGYSLELTTGTGGAQNAGITTYGDYSPADQVGFEVSLSFTSQAAMVYFLLKVWDGVDEHHIYARIDNVSNVIDVLNSLNAYVEAGSFAPVAVGQVFYSIKLVVNLATKKWVRLLVRGVEYDLSAIESWSSALVVSPYFSFQVLADHDAAVNKTLHLDRMIVTTNEP